MTKETKKIVPSEWIEEEYKRIVGERIELINSGGLGINMGMIRDGAKQQAIINFLDTFITTNHE